MDRKNPALCAGLFALAISAAPAASMPIEMPGCFGEQRKPTAQEIGVLFEVATVAPVKMRVVAEVVTWHQPWTATQVSNALAHQVGVMKADPSNDRSLLSSKRLSQVQLANSNVLIRAHTMERTRRVEEWYSANNQRQDLFYDSCLPTNLTQEVVSSVSIFDDSASQFQSDSINNHLRSVVTKKSAGPTFQSFELWRAFGIDAEASLPIIHALRERQKRSHDSERRESIQPRLDPLKVQRIIDGTDPTWTLSVCDSQTAGINVSRYDLRGSWLDAEGATADTIKRQEIQATYFMGKVGDKFACLASYYTNLTGRGGVVSVQQNFDSNGRPRLWETFVFDRGDISEIRKVEFIELDLSGKFIDSEVFTAAFPSNYTVTDVTHGRGVVLQRGEDRIPSKLTREDSLRAKRRIVLTVFLLVSALSVIVFFARWRSRQALG